MERTDRSLLPVATSIELASSQLEAHRRLLGEPAVEGDRDRTTTILHGDVLQSVAFETLGWSPLPSAVARDAFETLIASCRRVQEGHAILTARSDDWDDEAVSSLERRLGALTGAAAGLAATVHGASERRVRSLQTHGTRLGSHLWIHDAGPDGDVAWSFPTELGSTESIEAATSSLVERLPAVSDAEGLPGRAVDEGAVDEGAGDIRAVGDGAGDEVYVPSVDVDVRERIEGLVASWTNSRESLPSRP